MLRTAPPLQLHHLEVHGPGGENKGLTWGDCIHHPGAASSGVEQLECCMEQPMGRAYGMAQEDVASSGVEQLGMTTYSTAL